MILSSILDSLSSWDWPLLASVGGIIVLAGLWMEYSAGKKWYRNLDDFRSQKSKEKWGEKIVMLGIILEIVIGFAVAAKDEHDIKQAKITADKNNPLNQPVSDISAIIKVRLAGTNFIESPLWGSSWVATLTLCDLKDMISGKVIMGVSDIGLMEAGVNDISRIDYSGQIQPSEEDHGYVFRFNSDPQYGGLVPFLPVLKTTPQIVKYITDNVRFLVIDAKFIPHNAELLGGEAEILINGNVRLDFDILPQKAYPIFPGLGDSPGDSGFTMIATNATLRTLPVWMNSYWMK